MADKAYDRLAKVNSITSTVLDKKQKHPEEALLFSRIVGNCYTAALYLSIASLLEHDPENLEGRRIGCYSYGSGAVGEFFSCQVQPHYKNYLFHKEHMEMLASRTLINVPEYEAIYKTDIPKDGTEWNSPCWKKHGVRFSSLKNHIRHYETIHKQKM